MFDSGIIKNAIIDSFKKLNPASLIKNPVIFIVGIGALLTSIIFIL